MELVCHHYRTRDTAYYHLGGTFDKKNGKEQKMYWSFMANCILGGVKLQFVLIYS